MVNKKWIRLAVLLLAIVAIAFVIYGYVTKIETETVLTGSMENTSSHQALLIKNEFVVSSEHDGNMRNRVKNGDMVSRGKNIATVYDKNVDVETQAKLSMVTDKINEIVEAENNDDLFTTDKHKIDAQISEKVKLFTHYLNIGDLENASKIKAQINSVYEKKINISKDTDTDSTLNALLREQEEYEKILSDSKEEIYAPTSGYFSSNIDSFEEILTLESASSLSVSEFDSVVNKLERQISEDGGILNKGCKIIDNFTWKIAIKAEDERADDFTVGEEVFVNFDGIEKENSAVVESISESYNGYCLIILSTTEYNPDLIDIRGIRVNLVKNRYTGLKVPNSAIREVNGEKGVYVLSDTMVHFKRIDIVYSDKDYSIVKEDNSASNALLLYDEVITSDEELYDGMSIR